MKNTGRKATRKAPATRPTPASALEAISALGEPPDYDEMADQIDAEAVAIIRGNAVDGDLDTLDVDTLRRLVVLRAASSLMRSFI